MTWNSSPLQVNCRAEISSPSALAQWTEHRKACTETAPRFFCAAVAACFIVQRSGLSRAGSARWPNVRLWEVAGSRSHLWPILAGSRELGSNPLDKKRAFLRMIDLASQFEETAPGLSATRNRPPEPTENSVRINPHPCGTLIADLVDALSLLASTAESKDWLSLPRPVVECIQVQGVRVVKRNWF